MSITVDKRKDIVGDKIIIEGGTDGTSIGNDGDSLKVTSTPPANGTPIDPIPNRNVAHKKIGLLNGSSKDMIVDGSTTTVNFDFTPGAGETWYVQDIIFMMVIDTNNAGPNDFEEGAALTNGIEVEVKSKGNVYTIANMKDNAEVIATFHDNFSLSSDVFVHQSAFHGSIHFENNKEMVIQNSTSDYVRIKIQDNLTTYSDLEALEGYLHIWRAI